MRFRWLGILIIWLVLILVILEAGLRLVGPSLSGQIGIVSRYVTTGQPYEEDWNRAWQENIDHYYTLRPDIEDALQYGSPTVSFRLTTNKLWDDGLPPDEGIGFRNPPVDYAVDAVVVGDSFGFCFTERADCWVDQLAANMDMGIVNLSQPVTGSLSHLKMLQDFGTPLEPPLVIWQFFGNDFNDDYGLLEWRGDIDPIPDENASDENVSGDAGSIGDWMRRNWLTYAVIETVMTGQWSGLPEEQQMFAPMYTQRIGMNYTLEFGKLYERTALDMSRPANQFGLEQSRDAFEQAQALVESWGGRLVVVIIPTREEVYDYMTERVMGKEELDKHRSARQAMNNLCSDLALDCLDLFTEFQNRVRQGEFLYYGDDMHLNPEGNAAMAEVLENWLATLN